MAYPHERAQARQNFMKALDRPACRNCTLVREFARADGKGVGYQCTLGAFVTTAMAVCERHSLVRSQA